MSTTKSTPMPLDGGLGQTRPKSKWRRRNLPVTAIAALPLVIITAAASAATAQPARPKAAAATHPAATTGAIQATAVATPAAEAILLAGSFHPAPAATRAPATTATPATPRLKTKPAVRHTPRHAHRTVEHHVAAPTHVVHHKPVHHTSVHHEQAPVVSHEVETQSSGGSLGTFLVTCYDDHGTTASGAYTTMDTVAVDPSVIPLGTEIYISGVGDRVAQDTGGAIIGNRLDIWEPSYSECVDWGARSEQVSRG